ncbi:MAG: RHS repeat-associated core domain-containing protein, partial [Acidobacteriaceae bacterium]
DNNANLTKITSPSGRYITLTDDPQGRIITATDNGGRTVSYTYDTGGRLATVTDVNNGVTTFAYDSNDLMTSITDPRNIEYLQNQYDGNGRIIQQTQADGSTYKFQWTPSGNASQQWVTSGLPVDRYNPNGYEGYTALISQVVVTDPRGYQRQVQFNNFGMTISDTRALGQPEQETLTSQYYADNLVKSTTDALGRETNYDYDSSGNLTSLTLLAGTANAVKYTATYDTTYSHLLSSTDPLNHTTTFKYNGLGDLVSVQDPLQHGQTLTYYDFGRVASVTDALGNVTRYGYSGGILTTVTDPSGNVTTRFPDSLGRIIGMTDADGNTTAYQYDNMNRLTNVTNALGSQAALTYDPNGDLLSVQDFLSHTTSFTYDSMDRLSTRTDPLQRVSSVTYDLAGNPVSITDALNQVTSNTFDGLGRKVFTGFGTTSGESGPVYQSTITYQYDAGNRLTSAMDSIAGTITRTYDGLNAITGESGPQGSIAYGYDAAERRTSAQAGGQTAIQYGYDSANRLTGITQGTSSVGFIYDSGNRRTTLTLPNGLTVQYGYDPNSRVQSITYTAAGNSSIGNLTYNYDAAGQRTEIGGSLAHTNLPNAMNQATYDAANELTSWDGLVPTYDADGEMTADVNGNQYIWNARNQLTAISGANVASFGYDAFGRRISRGVGAQSISFQYDGLNRIAETSGGVTASLLPGALDEYFQRIDSSGTTFPITDALGSTIGMTDASGALATTYWYDPFGATTIGGAASANATQFAGRENDGTGLYSYRSRYYNPAIDRFISEDPTGFQAGMNEYAYVADDPLSFIDPFGLDRQGGWGSGGNGNNGSGSGKRNGKGNNQDNAPKPPPPCSNTTRVAGAVTAAEATGDAMIMGNLAGLAFVGGGGLMAVTCIVPEPGEPALCAAGIWGGLSLWGAGAVMVEGVRLEMEDAIIPGTKQAATCQS